MDGEPPEEGPGVGEADHAGGEGHGGGAAVLRQRNIQQVGEAGGGSDGRRAGDGQPLSSSAAMSSPDSPTRVFNE